MIGWDPVTRSQRLKLVVQLRRFLVPEKSRRPNLASQCLGLALTRNALLAIIPFDETHNLPSLIVDYQDCKQLAIDLILKARPFP